MKITGQQRKAISPIVATVLIIAATLIAFAAVAGYVFGLFGSATAGANAQVVETVFHASSGNLYINFTNSGGQSVSVNSMSVVIGSATYSAAASYKGTGVTGINPAVTTEVYALGGCTSPTTCTTSAWKTGGTAISSDPFAAGTSYTFSIVLSNGITATATATAT